MAMREGYCQWKVGRRLFKTRGEALSYAETLKQPKPVRPHIPRAHANRVVVKAMLRPSY